MEDDDDIATAGGKGWGDDEEEGFGSDGDVDIDGEKAAGEGSDGGKFVYPSHYIMKNSRVNIKYLSHKYLLC